LIFEMLKNRYFLKFTLTGFLGFVLSACSLIPGTGYLVGDDGLFRDRGGDYLEAVSIPRLEIPNNLDAFIIDDLLVIPDMGDMEGQSFVDVPRPRSLQGNPDRAVVIQRLEGLSWVVIDSRASQVWPRVRQYWIEQGIELAQENPNQGMLETIWFTSEENEGFKEKIRVIVIPGFQDDSAELSIAHVSAPEDFDVPEEFTWPEDPEDNEYAYQVLADISTYLADQIRLYQASTVSFLAGAIPDEGRASIRSVGENNVLHLDADFVRSWAAVGRALERANVEIVFEDMDAGIFDVAFSASEEPVERGMFSRLLSITEADDSLPFRVSLQQTDNGIDVITESSIDGQTGSATDNEISQEQQDELNEALLQAIYDFIS